MTASPANAAIGLLALAAAAWAGAAAAETAPTPLRRAPAAERPAAVVAPVTKPDSRPSGGSGVQVESLAAPDFNAVGVLDERRGGLGIDMWSGSMRPLVQKLLPSLPATTPSRTMRAMMRKLLLSTAAVPEGEAPLGPSLLAQRVERLWAMGDVEGMLALIDAAPRAGETTRLLRHRIDGLLLEGRHEAACADIAAARRGEDADGYLAKVEAFCHAVAGRVAEAGLMASWLRERGHIDPAFYATLEVLLGVPGPELETLPQPRPLHLAMLKEAKRPLPIDAALGNDPAVLRAVALSVNAPLDTRLLAAEKAEGVGALDTEVLRQLYAGTTLKENEAERSLDDAAEDAGARSRALLFRAAQLQTSASARAEIIAKSFALARKRGQFAAAARVHAPLIQEMAPQPDLGFFAGDALRALLAAGRAEAAKKWVALCERSPADAGPVWPLMRLHEASEDQPLGPEKLLSWLKDRKTLAPEQANRQAAVLFGLFDALGDRVGSEEWLALMEGPTTLPGNLPQPALWHAQRIAAEDLRLGETILLSLVSLGPNGPGAVEPTSLYRVIAALRLVGFDDEARALAVEAALANGV